MHETLENPHVSIFNFMQLSHNYP